MNKKIYCLALGAVLGGMLVSCTNELNEPNNVPNQPGLLKVIKDPKVVAWSGDQVLQNTRTFGQGADFGTMMSTRSNTRAADTWTYEGCDGSWEDGISFTLPKDAIDLTSKEYWDAYGNYTGPSTGSVFYIPKGFEGSIKTSADKLKFPSGASIYNYGKITELDVECIGNLTIYNAGSWDWSYNKGGRTHTIYNTGSFTVGDYSTIKEIYNSNELNLERQHNPNWSNEGGKADVPDAMSIYSTTDVNMPDGGDFKAAAHIHGTLYSDKDLKIQNRRTQYICGLFVEGTLEMTQGNLQTAYIEADEIKFDGAHIWLLPQAHIVTDKIVQPNAGCEIYGHSDSWGFVETKDIVFINDNDFNRSYSGNVYLNVTGEIDFTGVTNSNRDKRVYDSLSDYLTRYPEDSSRFNSEMSGTPACGEPYGNPGTPIEPDVKDECPGSVDPDHKKCTHPKSSHDDDGYCKECEGEDDPCHKEESEKPGSTPEQPETPETPDVPTAPEGTTEVEINLSLNDSHGYDVEDLVSKLSIHVRYPGDVEVFIPVPKGNYCFADDFNIREGELYILPDPEKMEFLIDGHRVTLTVAFEEDGIRVTTDGINEEVLAYCKKENGDGVNFEVYNYYGLYELNDEGEWVRAEDGNIPRETILGCLNKATVEFLGRPDNRDLVPDYYINAFKANASGDYEAELDAELIYDCTVSIVEKQRGKYQDEVDTGSHLNLSDLNEIYTKKGYDGPKGVHDHEFLWGSKKPAQGE